MAKPKFKIYSSPNEPVILKEKRVEGSKAKTQIWCIGNQKKITKHDRRTNRQGGLYDFVLPPVDGSVYAVVVRGRITATVQNFRNANIKHTVYDNQFITTKKGIKIKYEEPNTIVLMVQFQFYEGVFSIGNIVKEGNLNYINGAKNRVLSSPLKKGLPCLNSMHGNVVFDQTTHTHPSTRVGIMMEGEVLARIYKGEHLIKYDEYELKKGDVFILNKDIPHSFHKKNTKPFYLAAFHPDSSTGPTDEDAPMIANTIVDGISASGITDIHTK